MRWKQVFPLAGILIGGGVLVGLMWILDERDAPAIERAVLAHVRGRLAGKVEGQDFTIGSVEVLGRKDDVAVVQVPLRSAGQTLPLFFQLRRVKGDWTIEFDLVDNFRAEAETEPFAKGVTERLAKHLAERLRMTASVSMDGKPFDFQLVRDGADVLAKCRSAFLLAREDGKADRIEYVENFRYRDGRWQIDGPGQLLQFRQVP